MPVDSGSSPNLRTSQLVCGTAMGPASRDSRTPARYPLLRHPRRGDVAPKPVPITMTSQPGAPPVIVGWAVLSAYLQPMRRGERVTPADVNQSTTTTSGLPFSTTYVASSAAVPVPTFVTA